MAGGYFTSDPGLESAGRAGAFTAGADDLTAQLHNPAALVRTDALSVQLEVAGVHQLVTFDRLDEGVGREFDPVSNGALPMPVPGFAVGGGGETLGWAVGFYPMYGPRFSYPADGGQRYSQISSTVIETAMGPSVAVRATDWLSVGAGLQARALGVTQELTLSTSGEDGAESDIDVAMEAWDTVQLSWNVGVLVEPAEAWAVGVSFQPGNTYEALGSLDTDYETNFLYTAGMLADSTFTDEDITLVAELPFLLRSGVAWQVKKELELELGVDWQGWGRVADQLITDIDLALALDPASDNVPDDLTEVLVTDDVALPAEYRDTVAIALGAELARSESLDLRGGLSFETGAVAPEYLHLMLMDAHRIGASLGLSKRWGALELDAALGGTFFLPVDGKGQSEARQVSVLIDTHDLTAPPVVQAGKAVGNGSYTSFATVAGVGVSYRFGG